MGSSGHEGRNTPSHRTLTSLFRNGEAAEAAIERLRALGIPDGSFGLIADMTGKKQDAPDEKKGFWAKLEDFIFPEEDKAVYAEGIRRGGYVLTVWGLTADNYQAVVEIVEKEGAVDLDEQTKAWRSEGWDDTQSYLDRMQDPPTLIDDDEAAAIIKQGRGDEVIPVLTERLQVGSRHSNSHPRVRVYTVEHALKNPRDGN